jgi:DNA-binding CsgD family transcriptional regulator/ArsR family metal-binding transcriptional regulator
MQKIDISEFYTSPDGPMASPEAEDRFSVGAIFCFEKDISELFPYINAVAKEAELYELPKMIRFVFDGVYCVTYPERLMASPLEDKDHANKFREQISDFLNDIIENKNKITPKFKVFQNIPVTDILKLLPITNCKECGFKTCIAFAAMVSKQRVLPSKCPYVGLPINEEATYPVRDHKGDVISAITIPVDTTNNGPHADKNLCAKEEGAQPDQKERKDKKADPAQWPSPQFTLSKRELEVLTLMGSGQTNREISEQLYISPHTVKSHVINIFNKLGVNHRTQAVVWAVRQRII